MRERKKRYFGFAVSKIANYTRIAFLWTEFKVSGRYGKEVKYMIHGTP